jgi:tetratricopeptide (TPR) repeat protein
MSAQLKVETLLKEAELYNRQGLFMESRERYINAMKSLESDQECADYKEVKNVLKNRIRQVERNIAEVNSASDSPELSGDLQELIKDLFTFSKSKDSSAMEGALVLAKFGQYKKALDEFNRLLKENVLPVTSAKNILRCHLYSSAPDEAIAQLEKWNAEGRFSITEMETIKNFLRELLEKNGIRKRLPGVGIIPVSEKEHQAEREALEIFSVVLQDDLLGKGKTFEFEVTYHEGNIVSFVVPAWKKHLVEKINRGARLKDVQFYSPMGVLRGEAAVCSVMEIKIGNESGGYVFDIRIEGSD